MKKNTFRTYLGIVLFSLFLITQISEASIRKLYWVDKSSGKIQRANLDGTNTEDVITGLSEPFGLTYNNTNNRIYWTDREGINIQSSNLDESAIQTIISSGISSPVSLTFDSQNNKLIWSNSWLDKIQMSNMDGSSIQLVAGGFEVPRQIAIDTVNQDLYCADYQSIYRIDLEYVDFA